MEAGDLPSSPSWERSSLLAARSPPSSRPVYFMEKEFVRGERDDAGSGLGLPASGESLPGDCCILVLVFAVGIFPPSPPRASASLGGQK